MGFSAFLIAAAIVAIALWGFKEGIDFKGGALLTFRADKDAPAASEIQNLFTSDLSIGDTRVNYDAQNKSFFARLPHVMEESHQKISDVLSAKISHYEELSFQSIGPSVGAELRTRSLYALLLVLIGISLYIAFAFR